MWNWALDLQNKQYEKYKAGETDQQFLHEKDLRKLYNNLINQEEYSWLKRFQIEPARYIISRLDYAFRMFFNGLNERPKFKTKKRDHYRNRHSYRIRHDRFYIDQSNIRIPGLKYGETIKCGYNTGIHIKDNIKYHKVEVIKDNLDNYYVAFYTIENKPLDYIENIPKYNSAIGIDINARRNRRYVCSDGYIFEGPNIDSLLKHIDILNSKINKSKANFSEMEKTNPDIKLSKNTQKNIIKRRKILRKIHNIQENAVQTFTKNIINKNPTCIVMETLKLRNSMKSDHYIEKYIHFVPFFRCKEVMMYKADKYNIPFKSASPTYPSSQLCSNCGNRRKISRSTKIYNCPVCGIKIDRDLNAAINLEKLAYI